jgi:hypothetical protein
VLSTGYPNIVKAVTEGWSILLKPGLLFHCASDSKGVNENSTIPNSFARGNLDSGVAESRARFCKSTHQRNCYDVADSSTFS